MSLKYVYLVIAATSLCAAATTKLLSGSAQAAEPPQRMRWEYLCKSELAASPRGMAADVQRVANELGPHGWELVSDVGTHVFCFKRPLR